MIKSKNRKRCYFLVLQYLVWSSILLFLLSVHAVAAPYTELLPPGWYKAKATAINDNGTVAAWGMESPLKVGSGNWIGFLYSGGTYTRFLPPPFTDVFPTDINNSGDIIGYGFKGYTEAGFLYSGGTTTELRLDGYRDTIPMAINESGAVVGYAYGPDLGTGTGFLYSGGNYTPLIPPGWENAQAMGINDSGTVVGYGIAPVPGPRGFQSMGFLYSGGTYTPFLPPPLDMAWPSGINNNGDIIGNGFTPDMPNSGFLYSGGTIKILMLDSLGWPGYGASPTAINDNGTVVAFNGIRNILFSGGVYSWMSLPGPYGFTPTDINNSDAIVGWGYNGSTEVGFLAIPPYTEVPEPTTMLLLGSGLIGLAGYGRRKFFRK